MVRIILVAFALTAAACSSNDTKTIDAPAADAPPPGTFGATCTTVSDTSTECNSGVCTNTFDMIPHPVCSQKCTVLGGNDPSCPVSSMGQKCNKQGYCRP
jgi:hypothetical protein